MKRDSIFYKLFKQVPGILFELIDQSPPGADRYRFDSIEVKESAFRIDGVFLPPDEVEPKVVFFAEVQFQKDEDLYKRFFSEIFLFLRRSEVAYDDWGGVVIFGSRSLEPSRSRWYRSLLDSEQVVRIYLDEVEDWQNQPLAVGLALLTVAADGEVIDRARVLLERGITLGQRRDIIEWISTIMVYRFPQLGWEGVEAMFNIQDVRLEDTRAYQEIGEKYGQSIRLSMVRALLQELLGDLPEVLQVQVAVLTVEQLEVLNLALLRFKRMRDLETWLAENR